jgi:hypothetical protein
MAITHYIDENMDPAKQYYLKAKAIRPANTSKEFREMKDLFK